MLRPARSPGTARAVLLGASLCAAGLGPGCTRPNPIYCDPTTPCPTGSRCGADNVCVPEHPDGGPPDGPGPECTEEGTCPGGQHCLSMTCVDCRDAHDCAGGLACTPAHACAPCNLDADCDATTAGLCVDGVCPTESQLTWVDCDPACQGGDGTRSQPLCSLQPVIAESQGTPYVALVQRSCYTQLTDSNARKVDLLGRGSTLAVTAATSGVSVMGDGTDLGLHDLTIVGLDPGSQNGVLVTAGATLRLGHVIVHDMPRSDSAGAEATMVSSRLEVRRSLIYGNAGWGIEIADSQYVIENTFVLQNGQTSATPPNGTGGIRFSGAAQGSFFYNTICSNRFEAVGSPPVAKGAGVRCESGASPVLWDSLILDNHSGLVASPVDVSAGCDIAGKGDLQTLDTSVGQLTSVFFDPSQPAQSDLKNSGFHVLPSSTVRAKGVSAPDAPKADYDGDPRPPSGSGAPTPGADEPG